MKEADAEEMAKKYAQKWGVPWHRTSSTRIIRQAGGFSACSNYEFQIDTGKGNALAVVAPKLSSVERFEYYPNNPRCFMLPLWVAYPGRWRHWGGWRQSYGENYQFRWFEWWATLSDEMKVEYRNCYPEPPDEELSWKGFYLDISRT